MSKKSYSIEDILEFNPCERYSREKLKELWNNKSKLTVDEILSLPISLNDKIWFVRAAKITIKISEKGEEFYYRKGRLHREDGPAFITDKVKEWYINGCLCRTERILEMWKKDSSIY